MVNKRRLNMLHPSSPTEYITGITVTHSAMLNEEMTSTITVGLRATYGSVNIQR
jgi:hypothetical protein